MAWITHRQFDDFIVQRWQNSLSLVPKLRKLAGDLIIWNKDIFGNLFRRKQTIRARLEGIQRRLAESGQRHLLKLEAQLRKEYNDILNQLELLWFQKSRMEALRDGDRNTRYFHLSTTVRRRYNRVEGLQNQAGDWITEPDHVRRLVADFFASLYSEPVPEFDTDDILQDQFPRISHESLTQLERPFTFTEVQTALFSMGSFKAPGPDGFLAFFYQRFWSLVRDSVFQMVLSMLGGQSLPKGLNETYITLIPKVPHPQLASQFRPISLCNVCYTLITKVIVQRLKNILPELIAPTQTSFVPGRQIGDNIVIM